MSAIAMQATVLGFAAATPVGYTLEATLSAMGANLSNISASPARTLGGKPAPVSCLLDAAQPRGDRLVGLFQAGLGDLALMLLGLGISQAPLLLGLPANLDAATRQRLTDERAQAGFDPSSSAFFEFGRASAFAALAHAVQSIGRGQHRSVVVGGLDSLCAPASVEALAHARRVLEPFTEGTIPGEAASFMVLGHPSDARMEPDRSLWIDAVTLARGRPFSQAAVVDAQALTQVLHNLRDATSVASSQATRIERVVAAHSGEGYFGRSFSMGYLRAVDMMPEPLEVSLTADRVGDVGAACGPLGLAFAAYLMARASRDAPGMRRALVYTESDSGEVGGAILSGRPRAWHRGLNSAKVV